MLCPQELHILWDGSDQALDDEAFASLSKFSRLQTLNLSLVNMSNQSMWSNFSLGQLSALTALKFVSDWRNMGLLMSIASCSKVRGAMATHQLMDWLHVTIVAPVGVT